MPSALAGSDLFPSAFNIPSDGDRRSASSVGVSLEALADRTIWLKNRGVADFYEFGTTAGLVDGATSVSTTSGTFAYTSVSENSKTITNAVLNDWLEFDVDLEVYLSNAGDRGELVLAHTDDFGGASATVQFPSTNQSFFPAAAGLTGRRMVHLHGIDQVSQSGPCLLRIGYAVDDGSGGAAAGSFVIIKVIHGTIKRTKEPTVHP